MKVTALLRERNEGAVMQDTLDHLSEFASEIFVFDDASTDDSVDIAKAHPNVKRVLQNHIWNANQQYTQTIQRKFLLEYARKHAENEWFLYVDADERLEFDWDKLDQYDADGVVGIKFKLFDAYMTPDDKEAYDGESLYNFRKNFGPEYRNITFLFKGEKAYYPSDIPGIREPIIDGEIINDGFVQHYGKAISEEQWEETCKYYMRSMPQLADKWEKRQGKAIHTESDFGKPLYSWEDAKSNGEVL